jgi:hypothetical protein
MTHPFADGAWRKPAALGDPLPLEEAPEEAGGIIAGANAAEESPVSRECRRSVAGMSAYARIGRSCRAKPVHIAQPASACNHLGALSTATCRT